MWLSTAATDIVPMLQALTEFTGFSSADVDLTATIRASDFVREVQITPDNFDVIQVMEVPVGGRVQVTTEGKG